MLAAAEVQHGQVHTSTRVGSARPVADSRRTAASDPAITSALRSLGSTTQRLRHEQLAALRGLRADDRVDLLGHLMDLPGQVGVGLEFQLFSYEIVIGLLLLERGLPVLPDHDKGGQEIASSDTISVKVGHGLDSMNNIHTANTAMCR